MPQAPATGALHPAPALAGAGSGVRAGGQKFSLKKRKPKRSQCALMTLASAGEPQKKTWTFPLFSSATFPNTLGERRRGGGGSPHCRPGDRPPPALAAAACHSSAFPSPHCPRSPAGRRSFPGSGYPGAAPCSEPRLSRAVPCPERVWGAAPVLTLLQSGRPGWVLVRSPVIESFCSLAARRSRAICSPMAFMSFLLRADVMYMCISRNRPGCSRGARLQTVGPAPRCAPWGRAGLSWGDAKHEAGHPWVMAWPLAPAHLPAPAQPAPFPASLAG